MGLSSVVFYFAICIGVCSLLGCIATGPPTIGRRCFRGECPALPPEDLSPVCYWSAEVVAAPRLNSSAPVFDATQNTNNDTTMSIIAHVHLPATETNTFEESILLNISSSNCQIVAMNVITPSYPDAKNLEWLGLADLKTTHQGAIYCEAAPQCSIELHSALLTGFPLTESGVVVNSGENFYVEYNYTALEICAGWKLQTNMKVTCNESTSDYSFCRFMFGTECPERIPEEVTPSASPIPVNSPSESDMMISPSSSPSIGASESTSASASTAPELVIPPDAPIIPGTGATIFNQHFPQINVLNNRRV